MDGRRESELRALHQRVLNGTYGVDPREVADAILEGAWIAAHPSEAPTVRSIPPARSGDGACEPGLAA